MFILTIAFLSFVFAHTPEFLRDVSLETPLGGTHLTDEELKNIEVDFAHAKYKFAFKISAGNMGQIVMMKKLGGTDADDVVLKISTQTAVTEEFTREATCINRVTKAAITDGGLPDYSVQTCPNKETGLGASGPCEMIEVANRQAYFMTPFPQPAQDFLYIMGRLNPAQLDFLWKKAFNILKVGTGPSGDTMTVNANCHTDLNPNNAVVMAGGKVKVIDWDCQEVDPKKLYYGLATIFTGFLSWYDLPAAWPEDKFPQTDIDSGEAWKKLNLARLYMEMFGITEAPKTTFDDIFNKIENTPVTTADTTEDTTIMGQLDTILQQMNKEKKAGTLRKECEACRFINKRQWCSWGLLRTIASAKKKPEAKRKENEKKLLQTKFKASIADDYKSFFTSGNPKSIAQHWSKEDMIADMQTLGCPAPTTWPPNAATASLEEARVSSTHSFYDSTVTEIGVFGVMTFALVFGIYACTKETSPSKYSLLENEV